LIKEITTASSGDYTFEVECGKTYYLRGENQNMKPRIVIKVSE
jgi:hypothetical protein